MRNLFFCVMCLTVFVGYGQTYQQSNTIFLGGYVADDDSLPYWFYTNQYGRLNSDTNLLALASHDSSFRLGKKASLDVTAGFLYQDTENGNVQIDQLFAKFSNSWLQVTLGSRHPEEQLDGLSSTNGNILWSGNARAIPGLVLEASEPIKLSKGLLLDWGIGHYELGNDRFVKGTRVHYKRLGLIVKPNQRNTFEVSLQHFVQWGGTSPVFGEAPDGFSDFIDVFFAKRAGNEEAVPGEQVNALGNHLGSYSFKYARNFGSKELQLFHEHLFEDGSGTAFKNFPDGIWGAYLTNDTSWLTSILYEFVYTLNQSGFGGRSSNDNYFNNGFYSTGWRYRDRVIGVPFIVLKSMEEAASNRVRAHHLGFTVKYRKLSSLFKASYVEGLGTHPEPIVPKLKSFYAYSNITYETKNLGKFTLYTGFDILSASNNRYGLGVSYAYKF